eukprot:1346353-Prymnesium_polylepis.2
MARRSQPRGELCVVLLLEDYTHPRDVVKAWHAHAELSPVEDTRKGREQAAEDHWNATRKDGLVEARCPRGEAAHDRTEFGTCDPVTVAHRGYLAVDMNVGIESGVAPDLVKPAPSLAHSRQKGTRCRIFEEAAASVEGKEVAG